MNYNVESYCEKCSSRIVDAAALFNKYGNMPRFCEKCRRDIRKYRKNDFRIERKQLEIYPNLVAKTKIPFQTDVQDLKYELDRYEIYAWGGRNFGLSPWAGVSYDLQELVYVNPAIFQTKKIKFSLRKMEKKIGEKKWVYFVIDEPDLTFPEEFFYTLTSYHKTTLKGYGQDRNLSDHIEVPHTIIAEYHNRARSGRFGCITTFVVTKKEADIIKSGIA